MCKKCENGKNTKDEGRETCCDRDKAGENCFEDP